MSKQTDLNKLFYSCAATDIEGFDSLAGLTLDLRWSWDHGADEVWRMLDPSLSCVAYFSMEFMLSEALPIYSGGLGNVAGDQLKAASDLGIPVVGIGLLYQQGYFRQVVDRTGGQEALYPYNDPGQLPVSSLRLSHAVW